MIKIPLLTLVVLLAPAFAVGNDISYLSTKSSQQNGELTIPRLQSKNFKALENGACGLKRFTVIDSENHSLDSTYEPTRLTAMGAIIETTSPECIRNYGIVQYIRGCVYHSRHSVVTGDLIDRIHDVTRGFHGKTITFNHPSFEIDQDGLDPLYFAIPDVADRFAYAYVPNKPLKLSPDKNSMLSDLKALDDYRQLTVLKNYTLPTSVILAIDIPNGGVASFDSKRQQVSASNSYLDFVTCVYQTKDIPITGSPAGFDEKPENGGPLKCFTWSSHYTYDGETRNYITDKFKGMDPFCAEAPERK
jgi:hypothetical protein